MHETLIGLDSVKVLQSHANTEICGLAIGFIEKYFSNEVRLSSGSFLRWFYKHEEFGISQCQLLIRCNLKDFITLNISFEPIIIIS